MKRILGILAGILLIIGMSVSSAQPALARGTCWSGVAYRDAGTAHNFVEFRVNASAQDWHIEREWWAFYPASLWAYPDRNGIAKAGIQGTDWNPPYPASGYKICTGR